jgi:DNA polymerase-3 subunit delta
VIITLTGPNDFCIRQEVNSYIRTFLERHGEHAIERIDGETFDPHHVAELVGGTSLFADRRLIIMRSAGKSKALWDMLGEQVAHHIPSETTLVIVEPILDKRTKTYKVLQQQGEIKTLDLLSDRQLLTWIKATVKELGGTIEDSVALYLVELVGNNQWQLSQELEKLVAYKPSIERQAVDALVEPNPQAAVFEIIDAAFKHDKNFIGQQLHSLKVSEDPYRFFGLLVSQLYTLALVVHGGSRKADDIAKEAGVHPFVIRKMQQIASGISKKQIAAQIELLAACDKRLKSTSIDPWTILEQYLYRICQ